MSVNATDPSTFFGGTWERIAQGRTLVGEGSPQQNTNTLTGTITSSQMNWRFNIGDTGGEYEHQLTIAEMPSHTHKTGISPDLGFAVKDRSVNDTANVYFAQTFSNSAATGLDGAHNNIQPYLVVYIWKRTK